MKRFDALRTPLGLFAAAFAIRALPAASVFAKGQLFLRDGDAYYHLRRALYTLHHFPETLSFDWYVQFPHGAKIIWPPLFDACVALLIWPVAALAGVETAERAAAWIPPFLGALTVVAAWALARRYFGERAALWAGALLCVLGGHIAYSRLGALDHHVAVSLVSVLLLSAVMRRLAADTRSAARRGAVAAGLLSGLALLVWPGSLLYAALAFAGLVMAAMLARTRADAVQQWLDVAWAAGCAGLLVAPFSLGQEWPQWSAMSPVVLSRFQPWVFTCVAAVAGATALGIRSARLPAGALGRAALPLTLAALLLGACLAVSPELSEGLGDAWRWLAKGEEFQASVIESQPLFVVRDHFSTYMAHIQLSPLVYAFPFLWLYAWIEARRHAQPAPRIFLLGWTACLFALTLAQKRFLDTFSVVFAIQTAASAESLWRRLGVPRESVASRLAAFGALAVLFPLHTNLTPHLDNLLRSFQGEPLHLLRQERAGRILFGVSRWLRAYTPETSGWLDNRVRPEYGIMAPWSLGHVIQQVGRRPTVDDNFGDDVGEANFDLERRFWSSSVDEASRTLEELGVRYVVVTSGDFRVPPTDDQSIFRALAASDGSGSFSDGDSLPATGRYRLLMESVKLGRARRAYVKVFEFVPGAHIRGRTRPRRQLDLALRVWTNRKRTFLYRDRRLSDADGSFDFVVPYANQGGPQWLLVENAYALSCGMAPAHRIVSEREVRGGETLWVGDPCAPAPDE